jgi:tripartite motif-containing protein 71
MRRQGTSIIAIRSSTWAHGVTARQRNLRYRVIISCVFVLLGVTAFRLEGANAASPGGIGSSSLLAGPLIIGGTPEQAEQELAGEEARRMTPEAFAAREVSQTAYEHLSSEQAKKLAALAFPTLIENPDGGAPELPPGAKIAKYSSDYAAEIELPEHKRGVVESVEPIALETSADETTPINLQLTEAGSAFRPVNSAVAVTIPTEVGNGVELGRTGVSLTPATAQRSVLTGQGAIEGTAVIYPNTLTDADTLVKPTSLGFSIETLLRSESSPRQLHFRVGMPSGAVLAAAGDGSGAIEVQDGGATIARIAAPSAHDAEGASVPVTASVSGDLISLALPGSLSSYRLPIVVDPTVEDSIWQNEHYGGTYYRTEWYFAANGPYFTAPAHPEGGSWTEKISESHTESEFGALVYTTRGASQIVASHMEGEWNDTGNHIQNYMMLQTPNPPYTEDYDSLPVATEPGRGGGGYACAPSRGCPETSAGTAPPENGNSASFQQWSTGPGVKGVTSTDTVKRASVTISQEQGPELSFNTSSATIVNPVSLEEVPNVLYGSGGWLGPHSGAFEVQAKDPGLGLEYYRVVTSGWANVREYFALGECVGVQCPPYIDQPYIYEAGMHDGEPGFEALAVDPVGLYAHIEPNNQKIKVDATPPHAIKVSGFQNGSELPMGETHLKVEATDGSGSTKSSGIKSIKVSVDGHEVAGTAASCSLGPCSATTELTLAARNYSSGTHSLVVSAMDNASNLTQEEFTFRVHGAAPVSVGPGSVDPSTGELTLHATDVSPTAGIGISRTYQSRGMGSGAEGPLGPQWTIDLGGDESLTVHSGYAVLSASAGAETTFIRKSNGEFESPTGDGNLKLEAKEREAGKGISEYVLQDETAGTRTKFEQPIGAQSTTPTLAGEFGEGPSELSLPDSAAFDPSGDLWVTSNGSNLVEKYSPTGALLATYGSYGSSSGQFNAPWGIAVDPRNGDVYVGDQSNNRIDELSPAGAFMKAFGWGVSNGHEEFETCTTECRQGLSGAGLGQLNSVAGLAVDASGDLWVADYGNNRIQEFNQSGEYVRQVGSAGKGAEQLEGPVNIAPSGADLYVNDYRNNRVQEFSTTGAPVARFGECTGGPGAFSDPYGLAVDPRTGNLYIVDAGHRQVLECSPSGAFITKFGASGSGPGQFAGPSGVAVSASGSIYALDNSSNRIEEWSRPTWVPSEVGGPLSASTTTFAYKTVEREGKAVVEPSEALAPIPAGVTCGSKVEELKRGCRALTFNYASSTTATGESEGEWGDFKGNLTRAYYHTWDPVRGEMSEVTVAQYAYDGKGRLRAEWDPRISPALKTSYGYDPEGHVTSVSAPGQEPWLLSYGTIEGDSNRGRLLAAARPSAGTSLGNGKAPTSTTSPSLSTSEPQVGKSVTANDGAWSNSPLSYSYQWYDASQETGGEKLYRCTPIEGAVNQQYTPLSQDRGKHLYAIVTAMNAAGATTAATSVQTHTESCSLLGVKAPLVGGTGELAKEPTPAPPEVGANSVSTIEYHVSVAGSGAPYALGAKEAEAWGQTDDPVEGMAIFSPDEPMGWPAKDFKRATIHYWDSEARAVNAALPTGGIATTEYNETNDVVRTLSPDNRAAALAEGGKSAEAAKRLDTQSTYSAGGNELLETRGPQHSVKLSAGSTVLARHHVRYFYDEGAPSGLADGLLTKTTDGAEYEGKEADVRTAVNSYSGQENLGWKLRKPTSTTIDPAGLDLTTKTIYDPNTGNVVETRSPGGNSETIYPPAFASAFGSEGSGNGQLKDPGGEATDAAGDVWVADSGNNRIEEFSPSGSFLAAYGAKGSGNLQFNGPAGLAVNQSTGSIYIADSLNNRIEELSPSGAYVTSFGTSGSGALSNPSGVAVDASGDVWTADEGHNRIVEFSAEGGFIQEVGSAGSGNGQLTQPQGLALSEGSVYVLDSGNNRVEQFSTSGAYLAQFGTKGSGAGQFSAPTAIAANSSTGNLYVADPHNARIEQFSPAGRFLTEWGTSGPTHLLSVPIGLAISATGKLYASDYAGAKISSWTPPEAGAAHLSYSSQFGSYGSGNGQFSGPDATAIDGEGNLWVTDYGNNRIEKLSAKGAFLQAFGSKGSGNGQFNKPEGIDINQSTGNVYVADSGNARIQELSSSGAFIRAFGTSGSGKLTYPGGLKIDSAGDVWTADIAAARIVEFSSTGTFMAAYGSEGSGNGQFREPISLAFSGENIDVSDSGNHRIEVLSRTGAFVRQFGINGQGSGEVEKPEGIGVDAAGNLYVADDHASHVEEFTPTGGYLATFATEGSGEGQVTRPAGVSIDAAGDMYVVDYGDNRVEKWNSVNQAVHDTKTIYYSVAANGEYPGCGSHPEWANMPCETLPGAQPNTPGISSLPLTTATYSIWGVPETVTETFGSTTRTKKQTYDAAGRALTSEVSSSADAPLPKVTNEYNSSTGVLEKQSTTTEGKTRTITTVYNRLGQVEKYTDADGVTTSYSYDVDGRTEEVSYGTVDGATASQIYAYDPTTGALSSLFDTAVGTFTAKYDVEGTMTSETYPNGMTASYMRNAAGEATSLEYTKTTHCTSNCVWFSNAVTPSIHGETLKQTSTLSEEPSYSYDAAGRLTQVQESPAGKGCTTRLYAYDEEGNRTSLTTRAPGSKGECTSEGGTREVHIYDAAGRLSDAGVTYDAFGNVTSLPAGDAGGHELKSAYFVDNQVASQEQEEAGKAKTISFSYDPAGRTRETLTTGSSPMISHYAGSGEALSWTTEGASIWTRNIPGIDGSLCATQTAGQAPVLQLHDLQGNVVATAALSETETKPLSTYNSTEFGVPQSGSSAPKYAWLGASGLSTGLPTSGVITTGASSYVPEIGRALQSEPVASPGAFPDGTSAATVVEATYLEAANAAFKATAVEHEAALEAAARLEAEEKLLHSGCVGTECVPGPGEGNCEVNCVTEIIDPTGSHLATYAETMKYASELRTDASNADFISSVLAYLPAVGEAFGSVQAYTAYLRVWAHNLEDCAVSVDATGRCWVTITVWKISNPIKTLVIPINGEQEPCFWQGRILVTDVYKCENGALRRHTE